MEGLVWQEGGSCGSINQASVHVLRPPAGTGVRCAEPAGGFDGAYTPREESRRPPAPQVRTAGSIKRRRRYRRVKGCGDLEAPWIKGARC